MAKVLTFPETVAKYNIDKLYEYVRNGPFNYPGAVSIKKYKKDCFGNMSPCIILLKHIDLDKIKLEYGDIVNRHLLNGDWLLVNRQPSLHKMSMMGHKIVVLPGNTFRLNVTCTKPYNADFDGDEQNVHAPQSYQSSYELQNVANVANNIIDPASSAPSMGLVQDTVIGSYLLTDDKTNMITKKQMCNYLMKSKDFMGILENPENGEFWTGKQLFSNITQGITLIKKNKSGEKVIIKNGKLSGGVVDNSMIGKTSGGIIQTIYNQYNKEKCVIFMNDCQDVITRWMESNSFTIGYGDSYISDKIKEDIDKITGSKFKESEELIIKVQKNLYNVGFR